MTTASSLKIMVVEDDRDLLTAIGDTLLVAGYQTLLKSNGKEAFEHLKQEHVDLVLTDVNMPELDGIGLLKKIKSEKPTLPVIMMTAYGTVQKAVSAMKRGALDYLSKPFESDELISKVSYYLDRTSELSIQDSIDPVVADPSSCQLLALARRVADSNASVMITGESGTGKEALARYIHQQSDRADGPFVAINCAAIPDNMLEAILFGHEKGAFTGAHQSMPGKFEQANGGTLLLDEISEMEIGLQAKLLRVLQEREVERIGGKKTIQLDLRVLATTNRDLLEYVKEKKFREDLYYRLNVFPVRWLPLRSRKLDIIPLAKHLLKRHVCAQKLNEKYFDDSALKKLECYDWPGNVRELDNVVQRSLVLSSGSVIYPQDIFFERELSESATNEIAPLEQEDRPPLELTAPVTDDSGLLGQDLQQREFEVILQTLKAVNGKRKDAAEKLGISPRTLRYKLARMRELGVDLSSVG